MKKMKLYGFASALMLASAAGMTSCSSDSDITGGPTSTGTVKTQFAINIPRANGGNSSSAKASSRATGEETQGDGKTFLGMKNIWLLGFNAAPTDNATSAFTFKLTNIGKDADDAISNSNSNKIYEDVDVETGTTHFVFYGFGDIKKNALGAFEQELDLTGTSKKSLSDISFALKNISNVDFSADEPTKIVSALNKIDKAWPEYDADLINAGTKFHNFNAGSAKSACAMIQDLYDYIKKSYEQMPNALTQFETVIKDCTGFNITDGKVTTTLTFPQNLGLPDGSVSLSYDATKGFAYKEQSVYGAMNINPSNITYPALLSYYVNTPIYTNTSKIAASAWPTTWEKSSFTSGWTTDNAKVESDTKAIALSNTINYGVASLKLQVNCKAATLQDNNTETGNISVPDDGFEVTGLLIGNQPEAVDYKFTPKTNSFIKTIYDSEVKLHAKYDSDSEANYTIVLPNQVEGSEQQSVHFAIELTNNSGTAFEGYDGIVANGAKFYLVGTLSPENKTISGVTNPAVFMSDYQTEVTASISSLKNAYNTIPDIRTTNMQLGLNVDLKWKEGFKYSVEIGGDN